MGQNFHKISVIKNGHLLQHCAHHTASHSWIWIIGVNCIFVLNMFSICPCRHFNCKSESALIFLLLGTGGTVEDLLELCLLACFLSFPQLLHTISSKWAIVGHSSYPSIVTKVSNFKPCICLLVLSFCYSGAEILHMHGTWNLLSGLQ